MINILHIVNGWPSGGIIEQCYLVCKHLPKNKFSHVTIGFTHFDGAFIKKFEDIGVPCIHSDRDYANLKEVIDKYDIHIVHTQTGGGDYESYVPKLKEWGIPLVHQLHCPRACAIPADEVDTIIYTTPYTYEKNSEEHKKKMKSIQYSIDLKSPIRDIAHIRNFQDTNNYPIKVGRLGRIVPDKKPDVLLSLAQMCLQAYGMSVEFHVAGMIPQDYELHIKEGEKFKQYVEQIPNITYHGFVEDKYEFWKTLDICINPVWETSFDIVFLEAMACGIPILTWNNSAAPYVVRSAGLTTIEACNGDMFCGLHRLMSDEELRRTCGNNGIRYIKTHYSLEIFVKEYIALYESIVTT